MAFSWLYMTLPLLGHYLHKDFKDLDIVHFQGWCTTCTCGVHKPGKLLGTTMSTGVNTKTLPH